MTRSITALMAPVLLCGLIGPAVLAQEASPVSKSSNQGAFAQYDLGNATVYVSGNVLSGTSPYSSASFSMIDNSTYETLAYCQSMSPSITVKPSGQAEVRFTPQVDALCPSNAPIVLYLCAGRRDGHFFLHLQRDLPGQWAHPAWAQPGLGPVWPPLLDCCARC